MMKSTVVPPRPIEVTSMTLPLNSGVVGLGCCSIGSDRLYSVVFCPIVPVVIILDGNALKNALIRRLKS